MCKSNRKESCRLRGRLDYIQLFLAVGVHDGRIFGLSLETLVSSAKGFIEETRFSSALIFKTWLVCRV